jgi:hypothetical protein
MSLIYGSIVNARRGFAVGEDTVQNHWNLDEEVVGESAFQFSQFLVIIVLHHRVNIVRLLVVSSKSRAKQYVLLNPALNQLLFEKLNKLCVSAPFSQRHPVFPVVMNLADLIESD